MNPFKRMQGKSLQCSICKEPLLTIGPGTPFVRPDGSTGDVLIKVCGTCDAPAPSHPAAPEVAE